MSLRESMARLLKGGFIQRTKSSNLCPYRSAGRFACFVAFCFFNHSFNRWAMVTHLLRKVHPRGRSSSQQPPVGNRQKAVSLNQALLLGQVVWTFKFKWCHCQAQALTVLVGAAGHILTVYLIDSERAAGAGD